MRVAGAVGHLEFSWAQQSYLWLSCLSLSFIRPFQRQAAGGKFPYRLLSHWVSPLRALDMSWLPLARDGLGPNIAFNRMPRRQGFARAGCRRLT